VKRGLAFLALNYEEGDEIYLFGFSRGAYTARALAGVIGAAGIPKQADFNQLETVWNYYRVTPAQRHPEELVREMSKHVRARRGVPSAGPAPSAGVVDPLEEIRKFTRAAPIHCVAVWDTVGSYGVPSGFGLGALARLFATWTRGFHDTEIGKHIRIGLHAVGVDEQRRPFAPTFWTAKKGTQPQAHVEQVWFSGVHSNVGGGYPDVGLSDITLTWMVARVSELTGLEFDDGYLSQNTRPSPIATLYRSNRWWPISRVWPYRRRVLAPAATKARPFILSDEDPSAENINERVHWSVFERLGKRAPVDGLGEEIYAPSNVPKNIKPDQIANCTPTEARLIGSDRSVGANRDRHSQRNNEHNDEP
jgi:hypothetical protein